MVIDQVLKARLSSANVAKRIIGWRRTLVPMIAFIIGVKSGQRRSLVWHNPEHFTDAVINYT